MASLMPSTEEIVKGTEIIVFRELVSGIYFGDRTEAVEGSDAPSSWPDGFRFKRTSGCPLYRQGECTGYK